ncbi:copper chaperone PCu(A)C [Parapusillimonas sp. JC17]|uniref:copper chaperone PCu(A)C n=1 Tax=Parapusillimonas sp. JC17 TaxID=3445768 RepID=UPI003FA16FDB
MKKLIFSISILCVASFTYAANKHDSHDASTRIEAISTSQIDNNDNPSASKTLIVSNCWIRSLPRPTPSAGYFMLQNTGEKEAKLTSLTINEFDQISLHQTTNEGGKSKMSMAHEIVIPAGGNLKFKPGGYHAMLEKPNRLITIGTSVKAKLTFDSGETVDTTCSVKPPNTVAE